MTHRAASEERWHHKIHFASTLIRPWLPSRSVPEIAITIARVCLLAATFVLATSRGDTAVKWSPAVSASDVLAGTLCHTLPDAVRDLHLCQRFGDGARSLRFFRLVEICDYEEAQDAK